MTAQLLIIALDGADGALLDKWSKDGTLPNLASLRLRGTAKRLSQPPGMSDDGLWASFQYAASLGDHGRYYWWQQLNTGLFNMAYLDEDDRDSFWHQLSQQGYRIGIVDVPKCGTPKPMNGIHLSDWSVHGAYFKEPISYPQSLATEVVEKFGLAPACRGYHDPPLSEQERRHTIEALQASIDKKCALGCQLLAAEPWDLFILGFKEGHCAGHTFWASVDPHHPNYHESYYKKHSTPAGNPLKHLFKQLDSAIGALITAAGADANVVVFSPTDMVPNATLVHLMPEAIDRLNRLLNSSTTNSVTNSPTGPVCEILPYGESSTALRVHLSRKAETPLRSARTRETQLQTETQMQTIEQLLHGLIDVETNRPVIQSIERPSQTNTGPRASALPDLLIRCIPGTFPRAIASPQLGYIAAARPHLREGNHNTTGGFVVSVGATIDEVTSVQDFGAMATKVLQNLR